MSDTGKLRDPRVVEIEFLGELERSGEPLQVQRDSPLFGLMPEYFAELVYEFLHQEFVNGSAKFASRDKQDRRSYEEIRQGKLGLYLNSKSIIEFDLERPISIQLSHRGRVHLWRLRDEMLSNAEKEHFGILLNRRAWERHLPVQLGLATRAEPLGVMMLDLDHFKRVNDKCGHPKGDEVLKRSFSLIRDYVTGIGEAYRIGGEEIGVLCPKHDLDRLGKIAEDIREAVKDTVAKEAALDWEQTISIGATSFPGPCKSGDAYKFADDLLYEAKKDRDKVVARDPVEKS